MDMDFDTSTLMVTLSQFYLDIVDHALLAVAARLWEELRNITPQGERMQQTIPPVEQLRRSRLGQDLVLIARSVRDAWEEDPGVEEAMERAYRVLFGDTFGEGYTVPPDFHRSELGQLFHEAYVKRYGRENLLTPAQVYHDLGIARQTRYDRVKSGKLRLISVYGETRFLRSEVEIWKAQRAQRKQAVGRAE